jgi:hypothetical protein
VGAGEFVDAAVDGETDEGAPAYAAEPSTKVRLVRAVMILVMAVSPGIDNARNLNFIYI